MQPPERMLLPDWQWAILLSVASIGYFLVSIAAGTSFFVPDNGGPTVAPWLVWGSVVVFAVQAAPIAWRTRHPIGSFCAVFVLFIVSTAITVDRNLTVTPTLLFAVFSVTAYASRRGWMTTVGLAALVDLGIHVAQLAVFLGSVDPVSVLAVLTRVVPTYVAPVLAGLLYAAQRRRAALATDREAALRWAADSQLDAALGAERNRMARELHDIAAHHLSGLLIQTKAAIRVHQTNPPLARELLESIRTEADATLQNLRDVIGVLRDTDDGEEVEGPTLSRLPDLIASVRALHPNIDLTVTGDIDDLSPATSLACFRIIQESLTNARKYAPGADVVIHVQRAGRELVIEVENARAADPPPVEPGARAGYGVLGMRERASMLGGSLDAGPTVAGGWLTRATIPLERRVAA